MISPAAEQYITILLTSNKSHTEQTVFADVKKRYKNIEESDEQLIRCIKLNIIFEKIRNYNNLCSKEKN
jgi:hypothetical protein